MAVDTTLISGAYKANKPTAGDLAGVNTIANITKGLTDRVDMYVKVQDAKHKMRNAEYDAYAQSVLDNSDLVGSQYEGLYDELMAGKSDFASADEKTRALMGRNLAAMSDDYNDYKELREEVAINVDDYSPAFTNSDQGEMYLGILKGDGKRLINKDGRIGIEVDGEWKSISSIKKDLDANKIDKGAIDALEAIRITQEDSTKPFNYEKTSRRIMNSLVSKSSYNSLKNDEIIPGRIFRNDLAKSLMKKTYSDLGIKDEDFQDKEGNPIEGVNSDGIIDADEAENIIRHLEADETEMKKVMADYYTKYIKDSSGKTSGSIGDNSGYTVEEAKRQQRILIDEGYLPEGADDGAWGPKSQEALDKKQGSGKTGMSDSEIRELFKNNPNLSEYMNMPIDELRKRVEAGEADDPTVDEDGVFIPENKSSIQETKAFKSRLEKDGFESSQVSDEDVLAYFKDMQNKNSLNTEIYNSSNFSQWLKNNNKKRLEFNY
tara:strand:- start:5970 stop:7439 length:1470 start_codon:yes stop_codon:yes gene_type:complete